MKKRTHTFRDQPDHRATNEQLRSTAWVTLDSWEVGTELPNSAFIIMPLLYAAGRSGGNKQ